MKDADRAYNLRNLRPLDIENLAAGRITRQTMHEARVRVHAIEHFPHIAHQEVMIGSAGGGTSTYEEMWLADELNFMLEAAKESKKANDR